MRLLGSTEKKIDRDKNGEKVLHLEITEVILVHCDIVKNDYQRDSKVLYTFIPDKSFGQLLNISPPNFIFQNILAERFRILINALQIKVLNLLR